MKPSFVPGLPEQAILGTVLAYYGWWDQVQDLLQKTNRATRRYAWSTHLASLRVLIKSSKFSKSYGLPNVLTPGDIKKTASIRPSSSAGVSKTLQAYLTKVWRDPQVNTFYHIAASMVFDIHNFLPNWHEADVFVVLVDSKTYTKGTLVVNYADLYIELEVGGVIKVVVVCKLKKTTSHMK